MMNNAKIVSLGIHVVSLPFLHIGLRNIVNFILLFFSIRKSRHKIYTRKISSITTASVCSGAHYHLCFYKGVENKSGERIKRILTKQKHSCHNL